MKEVNLRHDLLAIDSKLKDCQLVKTESNAVIDIASNISNAYVNGETQVSFDLGIGNLYTEIIDSNVCWKFIPSNKLERKTVYAIRTGEDPLVNMLETELVQRLHSHVGNN